MNSVNPRHQQQWEDEILLVASTDEVLLPSVTVPLSGPLAKKLAFYDSSVRQTSPDSVSETLHIGWVPMPPSRNEVAIHKGDIGALCRASVNGGAPITLQVLERFRVVSVQEKDSDFKDFFRGSIEVIPRQSLSDVPGSDTLLASFRQSVNSLSQTLVDMRLSPTLLKRLNGILSNAPPENLIDILSSVLGLSFEEKYEMLVTLDVKSRLDKTIGHLDRILVKSKQLQLTSLANDQRKKMQRQALLKRQLVSIKKELESLEEEGDDDKDGNEEPESDAKSLLKRIIEVKLPKEIHTAALRDVKRLKQMPPSVAEYQVLQSYLEVLLELPWTKSSQESYDVPRARKILDEDHQGLERVKNRILEYIAVCQLTQGARGPILCFIGPPGVGKTSLGKSIARALERPFHRISLGGVHDEAQIRGHRRTYVGALPGILIQAYRKSHVNNPVFLLVSWSPDEIDKLGRNGRSDPTSAFLEVLDPEQNQAFTDAYLGLPFDLSKTLFIATANDRESIPAPLLDRMEIIELPGYTLTEKIRIAQSHLLPKQIKAHGLDTAAPLSLSPTLLTIIIQDHTREAGVRQLERHLAAICRFEAIQTAQKQDVEELSVTVLETILGPPPFEDDSRIREGKLGIATGMAWTPVGGTVLFIEAITMPGTGKLYLTGNLGSVMKESAQLALSWIKSNAPLYPEISSSSFSSLDFHIHFPAGAVPKDGPSAGITVTCALFSQLTRRPLLPGFAMTGELSLHGQVLKVGGIREKVLAAYSRGIRKFVLPKGNRKNWLVDLDKEIRDDCEWTFVVSVSEVIERVFGIHHSNKIDARL